MKLSNLVNIGRTHLHRRFVEITSFQREVKRKFWEFPEWFLKLPIIRDRRPEIWNARNKFWQNRFCMMHWIVEINQWTKSTLICVWTRFFLRINVNKARETCHFNVNDYRRWNRPYQRWFLSPSQAECSWKLLKFATMTVIVRTFVKCSSVKLIWLWWNLIGWQCCPVISHNWSYSVQSATKVDSIGYHCSNFHLLKTNMSNITYTEDNATCCLYYIVVTDSVEPCQGSASQ